MPLSRQTIQEFQEVYEKITGEKIEYEDALVRATEILRLFRLLLQCPKSSTGHALTELSQKGINTMT